MASITNGEIEAEVEAFNDWFSDPTRAKSRLLAFEKAILRAFIYWQRTVKQKEGGSDAQGEISDGGGVPSSDAGGGSTSSGSDTSGT